MDHYFIEYKDFLLSVDGEVYYKEEGLDIKSFHYFDYNLWDVLKV